MRKMCITALLAMVAFATPASSAIQSNKPETVIASWYAKGKMSNGKPFNYNALTAAHRWLPKGTRLKLTNVTKGQHFGRTVIVTVNDRGPWDKKRTLDLSLGAAKVLGMVRSGNARVLMEVL